jgi:hypothetical protein
MRRELSDALTFDPSTLIELSNGIQTGIAPRGR